MQANNQLSRAQVLEIMSAPLRDDVLDLAKTVLSLMDELKQANKKSDEHWDMYDEEYKLAEQLRSERDELCAVQETLAARVTEIGAERDAYRAALVEIDKMTLPSSPARREGTMLYVLIDVYRKNGRDFVESRLEMGPYERVVKSDSEFFGIPPGGDRIKDAVYLMEGTVGRGGYCDTCAYEYPSFTRSAPREPEYEVKGFEIEVRP